MKVEIGISWSDNEVKHINKIKKMFMRYWQTIKSEKAVIKASKEVTIEKGNNSVKITFITNKLEKVITAIKAGLDGAMMIKSKLEK